MAGAQRWELPVFNAAPAPLRTAAQLDDLEAAAHEEGFARGHADGLAAGMAEMQQQAQRLRQLLEHCAQPLAQLDADVEAVLVELALRAARQLVQQEFEIDPARMAATVNEAVAALVVVPRELRVLLHPDDARLLKDTLVRPAEVTAWRIVPDPTLARGDCRIAGDSGWVDATLATRERSLAQALLDDGGTSR
ncbi:FliH/SctL family protein [Nevskia soli]|uniref:FliH/SctL family protein n=1 Tax=Nevskia soli TaxID=418856 RepID=UPI00068C8DCF|nr:FliH/SctL family protein [Nevskia soli]